MEVLNQVIVAVKLVALHGQEILMGVNMILAGLIAIFMFIPGPQPEKALHGLADTLAKFSKKPSDPTLPPAP